ncbi:Pectin lyase fold/virulence factor protein [Dioscorea alata]|uniref:Pectin lyase fold/virulence factor protein n=2 Tax=Dioscorea alata TaxID=55571 RepID=A0ACB7VV36_DIOAL|nr:Pectin lyase fold/virulence factor protein [Dioscorea alata]KAH7678535.1 Pectin lyase fold/virulence factor protein [Dioscorea alata]
MPFSGDHRSSAQMLKRSALRSGLLLVVTLLAMTQWVAAENSRCKPMKPSADRPHSVSITDFGAVGDGVTINTKAFQNALFYLHSFADKGGAQLFVPSGRWLTGSFSLISHLTLSLDKDAVIIGSTDLSEWPIIDPLPSYGRGRELPGGRHQSLIYGNNLTDVIITGGNGTIDGQGGVWWDWFKNKTLNYTRPHLVEFMYSTEVVISNITFVNSPFWAIHPVYCSQVLIQDVTILAPLDSPNTDGIDPDSSSNVCIEDCYISTGDDLIVIKSGWDEYGISFAHPSSNISIHRVVGETGSGAGIAFGSEMSGGISEVKAEGIHLFNSKHGIRIKTSPGRGGYVRNIFISDVTMKDVDIAIRISGNYGEHPGETYDPKVIPIINGITIQDVSGVNISKAGLLEGIRGDNFSDICLTNVVLNVTSHHPWNCSFIEGYANLVSPESCEPLKKTVPDQSSVCYAPDHLQPQFSNGNRLMNPFLRLSSL